MSLLLLACALAALVMVAGVAWDIDVTRTPDASRRP